MSFGETAVILVLLGGLAIMASFLLYLIRAITLRTLGMAALRAVVTVAALLLTMVAWEAGFASLSILGKLVVGAVLLLIWCLVLVTFQRGRRQEAR